MSQNWMDVHKEKADGEAGYHGTRKWLQLTEYSANLTNPADWARHSGDVRCSCNDTSHPS